MNTGPERDAFWLVNNCVTFEEVFCIFHFLNECFHSFGGSKSQRLCDGPGKDDTGRETAPKQGFGYFLFFVFSLGQVKIF